MPATLSSNTFRMALAALERSDVDVDAILEKCRVPRATINNVWARVPIEKERVFWQLVSEAAKDDQIGLSLGEKVPFGTFPLLEYVGASCSSVLQALHLLTKYSKIVYGGWNPELDETESRTEFRLGSDGDAEACRHTTEFAFSVLWQRLKDFAATDLTPAEVRFRHRQQGTLEIYQRVFGGEVHFEASEDILVLPPELGKLPCKNSNPLALGSLIHGVDALFSKLTVHDAAGGASLIQSIKAEIENLVSSGEVSADQIAQRIGISKRTLQRRLEIEGRSLRALIGEVRRDIATRFLRESEKSVEQIALEVGYSDLKAFNRAFTEWYRMSPTAFRRARKS